MSQRPQPVSGASPHVSETSGALDDVREVATAVAVVDALAALQHVRTRDDLLLWADRQLRPQIQYTSMACLLAEPHRNGFVVRDVIAPDDVVDCLDLVDGDDAVSVHQQRRADHHARIVDASCAVLDQWMRDRHALQMGMVATRAQQEQERVGPLLECFKVDAVVAHGVKEAFGGSATFFIAGVAADVVDTRRALDVLTLLMPALHVARQRIHREERALGIQGPAIGLTPREVKILTLVAAGHTDEEAARSVGRSVHTIKNQMRHLVTKLGARNRTQAVLIAERHDLLDVEGPVETTPAIDPESNAV